MTIKDIRLRAIDQRLEELDARREKLVLDERRTTDRAFMLAIAVVFPCGALAGAGVIHPALPLMPLALWLLDLCRYMRYQAAIVRLCEQRVLLARQRVAILQELAEVTP